MIPSALAVVVLGLAPANVHLLPAEAIDPPARTFSIAKAGAGVAGVLLVDLLAAGAVALTASPAGTDAFASTLIVAAAIVVAPPFAALCEAVVGEQARNAATLGRAWLAGAAVDTLVAGALLIAVLVPAVAVPFLVAAAVLHVGAVPLAEAFMFTRVGPGRSYP